MNRFAVPAQPGGRPPKDVPKEFVTKAGGKAFEAANRISELLRDGESYFIAAPFTGYCAFLSSTVHVFGVFSKNTAMETSSKKNLATNVKYLSKMKRYWGMFHWMSENLKEQYKMCADAARQGPSSNSNPTANTIFQYGDWFDRYPHGVSQSAFEDPASGIKQEKGDDAVLEQKSDYHTVEEFFHTLSPLQPQDRALVKPAKQRKLRKSQTPQQDQQDQPDSIPTEIPDDLAQIVSQQQQQQQQQQQHHQIQMPPAQTVPQFSQMSPGAPVSMYAQGYYNADLFLPPYQHGILPHLDRQLVFGAYAGMDPSSLSSQNMLDSANAWDLQMGGMTGFATEPSSAWSMPFNMEPPEINQDADIFSNFGTMGGFSMDGMHVNNGGNGMGGFGSSG